jgi:hypothetical protein
MRLGESSEALLTPVGELCARSERLKLPPLPVGFINGNTYKGGTFPPFRADRVINTLRGIIEGTVVSDDSIVTGFGLPTFPSGCRVAVDDRALASGRSTEALLTADIAITQSPDELVLTVTKFPPDLWGEDIVRPLSYYTPSRWTSATWLPGVTRLPILEITNSRLGAINHANEEVRIVLEPDADADAVIRLLREPQQNLGPGTWRWPFLDFNGVTSSVRLWLREPLAARAREWVTENEEANTPDAFRDLEEAIGRQ